MRLDAIVRGGRATTHSSGGVYAGSTLGTDSQVTIEVLKVSGHIVSDQNRAGW